MTDNTPRPALLGGVLIAGVLAMSSASIFIRLAQQSGIPSISIAAYRLTIATLALTIPAARQHTLQRYAKLTTQSRGLLLISGILLGLHFATWTASLEHTSILASVVLVTTTPLWIGLASPLLLKEATPPAMWLGILLAIVGGILVAGAGGDGLAGAGMFGNALALAGAVFAAGYLMIGRNVRESLPLIPYIWGVYGAAALMLITWALIGGFSLTGFPPTAYLWLIGLGLIPQLIGHTAANYAVRYAPASFVAVATLGEPIGSAILGVILLKESPLPLQILGGTIILAAILIASRATNRNNKDEMNGA